MDIIQGQSKKIRMHLVGKLTRNKVDLTGVTFIEVCIPAAAQGKSVDLYYETDNADVDGTTATVTNIASTVDIQEGMAVSGAGIPANTFVLKCPNSLTGATAAGTVLLSNLTTVPGTQVPLLFQNIYIEAPATDGVIFAATEPQHSKLMKVAPAQTIEVTYITPDGKTHKTQIVGVLNVVKSIC